MKVDLVLRKNFISKAENISNIEKVLYQCCSLISNVTDLLLVEKEGEISKKMDWNAIHQFPQEGIK